MIEKYGIDMKCRLAKRAIVRVILRRNVLLVRHVCRRRLRRGNFGGVGNGRWKPGQTMNVRLYRVALKEKGQDDEKRGKRACKPSASFGANEG